MTEYCTGVGCVAKRDCRRYQGQGYWVPASIYQPDAGYQCDHYSANDPAEAPEWVKRMPEMRRA
jgi:hypothetical protein